tara:strand:- start:42 stop:341 length:300 start_codon:yes stop_codon:yes gene_type:complete
MKFLFPSLLIFIFIEGCTVVSPEIPNNSISYELHKSSDFDYSGKLTVNELPDGLLEFEIQLQGAKGKADTEYLTHLHFGSYDSPDAPIAMYLSLSIVPV